MDPKLFDPLDWHNWASCLGCVGFVICVYYFIKVLRRKP